MQEGLRSGKSAVLDEELSNDLDSKLRGLSGGVLSFLRSVGLLPGSTAIGRFQRRSRRWPDPSCWAARSRGTTSAGRTKRGGWRRLLSAGWRLYRPPCPAVQSTLSQDREKERATKREQWSEIFWGAVFFKHQHPSWSPSLLNECWEQKINISVYWRDTDTWHSQDPLKTKQKKMLKYME